jgi:type II secretory pathway pseudopilin PulG
MAISTVPMRPRKQAGYSLLMVVFLVATVLILAVAAAPNFLTQGRREREQETVWRGEQYERAIGLYFRKFGKYPTKIDDLTKQTNGVRFLRQAYTDPMNKEDGSWRFIYVGPNGQLIGSLRRTSLLLNVLPTAPVPGPSAFGAASQTPPAPPSGATPGTAPGAPAPNPLQAQPQPLQGAVLGGNIIGVASKVKQHSLRIYQGGDTYEQWEFIWNPNQLGQGIPGAPASNQLTPGTTPPAGTPPAGAMPAPGATSTPPPATTSPATSP